MEVYSFIPDGVYSDYNVSELEHCNIVYMCIKNKDNSDYHIPDNLEPLVNSVLGDVFTLKPELYDNDHKKYCYLTIKKMYVMPDSIGNRDGFHIDGFLSDQENFIWSDCDEIPTEVAIGTFCLTDDHNESLGQMMVQSSYMPKKSLSTKTLYEMNQHCVHRPTKNHTSKPVLRTFIKITFSKELFNCYGNAWNYKLPNIKPNKQRSDCRNHSVKY